MRRPFTCLAVALAVTACMRSGQTTNAPAPHAGRADPLAGRWTIKLALDSAVPAVATAGEVEGWIEFGPDHEPPWDTRSPHNAVPEGTTYEAGQYELDLRPFTGASSLAPGHVAIPSSGAAADREALAFHLPGDTTGIMLNPRVIHGGITLTYTAPADTVIIGTWRSRSHPPAMMKGSFTMRRVRP